MTPRTLRKMILFLGANKYGLTGETLRRWTRDREIEMIGEKVDGYREAVSRDAAMEV